MVKWWASTKDVIKTFELANFSDIDPILYQRSSLIIVCSIHVANG